MDRQFGEVAVAGILCQPCYASIRKTSSEFMQGLRQFTRLIRPPPRLAHDVDVVKRINVRVRDFDQIDRRGPSQSARVTGQHLSKKLPVRGTAEVRGCVRERSNRIDRTAPTQLPDLPQPTRVEVLPVLLRVNKHGIAGDHIARIDESRHHGFDARFVTDHCDPSRQRSPAPSITMA
ncbi:hypothetical protein [Caballeronia sp. EK]|uniref:hypothetical protein n=1 Tax=Caballeronia sp. EK TaxID=2767469 RepID=UPI002103403B|nr:hypothetical protein [Caballeronia sp. EK]